jgi:DEAD/DEAH box helicase domain-containing protein
MNTLIYDIEIIKAIPDKTGALKPGIEYCAGRHDHANMEISVIGAYDYNEERYRVFLQDNMEEFFHLCDACDTLVGFNNIAFDNAVINAHGSRLTEEKKFYDLLVEIWAAAGLGPKFKYPTHAGFGLDACCHINFGTNKTGNGALAPVLWQRGEHGQVIDYCLNDVRLTKQLLDKIIATGELLDPRNSTLVNNKLIVRKPPCG